MNPDEERFKAACRKVIGAGRGPGPIGTLGEKTLHAVLKHYFEPCPENHEVKLGSFYADAVGENGIIEIQTRHLYRLRQKLLYFLAVARVTLVYPIPQTRYVSWVNTETGEVTDRRKSPKTGRPADCFAELYGIKEFLNHPNLTVCMMMLNVCDYRNLDGRGENKKRGSTRHDRIPEELVRAIYLHAPSDYLQLLPFSLPETFTAADFQAASRTPAANASRAVNILCHLGVYEKCGKQGRSILYRQNERYNQIGENTIDAET